MYLNQRGGRSRCSARLNCYYLCINIAILLDIIVFGEYNLFIDN